MEQARWSPAPKLSRDIIATIRAKTSTTAELPLYSKLSRLTAVRLGQGEMVGGNPEARQGTGGNLHGKVSSNSPMLGLKRQ